MVYLIDHLQHRCTTERETLRKAARLRASSSQHLQKEGKPCEQGNEEEDVSPVADMDLLGDQPQHGIAVLQAIALSDHLLQLALKKLQLVVELKLLVHESDALLLGVREVQLQMELVVANVHVAPPWCMLDLTLHLSRLVTGTMGTPHGGCITVPVYLESAYWQALLAARPLHREQRRGPARPRARPPASPSRSHPDAYHR